jgi:hypothetical protein
MFQNRNFDPIEWKLELFGDLLSNLNRSEIFDARQFAPDENLTVGADNLIDPIFWRLCYPNL